MMKRISVIIPNYNSGTTIGKCLEAAFSSTYPDFEVIAVDDCSTDGSIEIIKRFPCILVPFDVHSGASRARNAGAQRATGDILFFIDADCILQNNALSLVANALVGGGNNVIGGTYTAIPYDDNFFSTFQSIFIHYAETKKNEPDYIATHAMAINRSLFIKSGGFSEDFLPILEDVEFSHRLRRSGHSLVMCPDILVQHVFNFTFTKSLKNAFRKSLFWTEYSLANRDLFTDSGTASRELKANVVSLCISLLLLLISFISVRVMLLYLLPFIIGFNVFLSRGLIRAFYQTKGALFAIGATIYYMTVYPLAIGAGALTGLRRYLFSGGKI
ncbi:MAG TPA: glycosyltransferase family A protein [Thermodesulfovibrionales bacterium]|nr:glycosyltransferase family A protein [Thermodesulfovibrionales bacterium]